MQNIRFKSPEETLETLRLATEAACVGIFDWDLASQEVDWSRYARQIFGVGPDAIITPQVSHDKLHPEDESWT